MAPDLLRKQSQADGSGELKGEARWMLKRDQGWGRVNGPEKSGGVSRWIL